jgi:hypothetical protein
MNKSIIKDAGECLRRAWFGVREPVSKPPSAADELLSCYGKQVGIAARREFHNGVLIQAPSFAEALAETQRHLAYGTETLFEAAFLADGVAMKADVLQRNGMNFRLIEVKSGLHAEDYYEDIAVQIWVLNTIGIKAVPFLMLLDGSATLASPSLFKLILCAKEVEALMPGIHQRIEAIKAACRSNEWPKVPFTRACKNCDYVARCLPDLPEHGVFSLYRGGKKIDRLLSTGIRSLAQLPTGVKLSELQSRQVQSIRTGRPWVSPDLQQHLLSIRYPAYFLDFEAMAHPLPQYPGQRSYSTTPFQFSCHVVKSPNQAPEHRDFLATCPGDPRPAFAEALLKSVGIHGSIIVYTHYESTIIRSLAIDLPHLGQALLSLIPRIFDLHAVIRNHFYHARFFGSFSVKSILPVLVPELNYRDLAIQDGLGAVWVRHRILDAALPEAERQRLATDLRRYCEMDSLAMVKVFEALLRLANESSMAQAFRTVLKTYAAKHGITIQEAFNLAMTPDEAILRRKWGPMPDKYDPRSDDSHPD